MMRRARRTVSAKVTGKAATKEADKLEALFSLYKAEGDDEIQPDGVERFCTDLGLDPADRRVLLLAWKMGAQKMGFFTRQEFLQGFKSLRATDLPKLRKALELVEDELGNSDAFLSFYTFAFRYCLTEPGQKILDVETAAQMLALVMDGSGNSHMRGLIAYLPQQTDYSKITMDQWLGFYRFQREIKGDYSNYDDSQAWPLLLDNFVEWAKANGTKDMEM